MSPAYPSAVELANAVEAFLRDEVMPALDGRLRFHALVAANVMAILGRELALGPEHAAAHAARLEALGVGDDAELAAAIRSGAMDDRLAELLSALRASVEAGLRVANPKHLR
ncbi:MAG TPA: DUF6285 domain-containing protein [Mycobacteriales bacterium]|jgi:hypothetical protein|nr:DUF6285 domain-containing protein [Mycobacteriales bacterium]